MALSESQLIVFEADLLANTNPEIVAAIAVRDDTKVAEIYNSESSFIVWRESIEPDEYWEALDWTEVDNLTAGKARIWEWVTQGMTFPINAAKANVRAGLNNAFNNTNSKANLLDIAREPASLIESLFATGAGTLASPGVRTYKGTVSVSEVGRILNAQA